MGFWSKLGKVAVVVAKTGAAAVVDTVAAGKPVTLGNIGVAAAGQLGKNRPAPGSKSDDKPESN